MVTRGLSRPQAQGGLHLLQAATGRAEPKLPWFNSFVSIWKQFKKQLTNFSPWLKKFKKKGQFGPKYVGSNKVNQTFFGLKAARLRMFSALQVSTIK